MTCNQCSYSSIGRFNGEVRLHCGLVGSALSEMPSHCIMGRANDAASERYCFWLECDGCDEPLRNLPARPR